MASQLLQNLIAAGYAEVSSIEEGGEYVLYVNNKSTGNVRIAITNQGGRLVASLGEYADPENNTTLMVDLDIIQAKVCLTPEGTGPVDPENPICHVFDPFQEVLDLPEGGYQPLQLVNDDQTSLNALSIAVSMNGGGFLAGLTTQFNVGGDVIRILIPSNDADGALARIAYNGNVWLAEVLRTDILDPNTVFFVINLCTNIVTDPGEALVYNGEGVDSTIPGQVAYAYEDGYTSVLFKLSDFVEPPPLEFEPEMTFRSVSFINTPGIVSNGRKFIQLAIQVTEPGLLQFYSTYNSYNDINVSMNQSNGVVALKLGYSYGQPRGEGITGNVRGYAYQVLVPGTYIFSVDARVDAVESVGYFMQNYADTSINALYDSNLGQANWTPDPGYLAMVAQGVNSATVSEIMNRQVMMVRSEPIAVGQSIAMVPWRYNLFTGAATSESIRMNTGSWYDNFMYSRDQPFVTWQYNSSTSDPRYATRQMIQLATASGLTPFLKKSLRWVVTRNSTTLTIHFFSYTGYSSTAYVYEGNVVVPSPVTNSQDMLYLWSLMADDLYFNQPLEPIHMTLPYVVNPNDGNVGPATVTSELYYPGDFQPLPGYMVEDE